MLVRLGEQKNLLFKRRLTMLLPFNSTEGVLNSVNVWRWKFFFAKGAGL
jgi:hypothetical protein